MSHKVFWLEPTDLDRVSLRRYHNSRYENGQRVTEPDCPPCTGPMGYHDASVVILPELPREEAQKEFEGGNLSHVPHDDPRWPTQCTCGWQFTEADQWQVNHHKLYRSGLDGVLHTLRDASAGAMWDAHWYRDHANDSWTGPDGLCLVVRLPNGSDWIVDSEASNCTRTQFSEGLNAAGQTVRQWTGRTHWCWVRHGDPKTGELHVDKNGETCSAGAGSILSGDWHGFLHNGYLVP